jgi:hypothetical protein
MHFNNTAIQQLNNTTILILTKKFDIKRTLGNPTPPLSIEAVEEMTKLIHTRHEAARIEEPKVERVEVQPVVVEKAEIPKPKKVHPVEKIAKKKHVTIAAPEPEKGRRGRKPNPIVETERLLRVSVDLPESVFIQLKILVIQQKTDMKAYIRKMVERELN